MKELASEIRAEGRRRRVDGISESAVLAELDSQRPRWLAFGRALLDQRLEARADLTASK
jgi:hypothetical protein